MAAAWLFYTGCRVSEAVRAQQEDVRFREELSMWEWVIPHSKTHTPRTVRLPDGLVPYITQARKVHSPRPNWPLLWDCSGRGFAREEDTSARISEKTINSALERARDKVGLQVHVTAHVAKHSYCTNWIRHAQTSEFAMQKLSRQVGTSVEVLRATYVHLDLTEADWHDLRSFGAPLTAVAG